MSSCMIHLGIVLTQVVLVSSLVILLKSKKVDDASSQSIIKVVRGKFINYFQTFHLTPEDIPTKI